MAKLSSLLGRAVRFVSSAAEAFAKGVERVSQIGKKAVGEALERAKGLIEKVLGQFGSKEEEAAAKKIESEAEKLAGAAKGEKAAEAAKAGEQGPKLLTAGKPPRVIKNKLLPHEEKFAQDIVSHQGGEFVGATKRSVPGIDGFLEGVPVSLKETQGGLAAVLSHASRAEAQASNAGYRGVEVFIKATKVDKARLLDFALKGPLTQIPKQGVVKAINVLTEGGWVRIIP